MTYPICYVYPLEITSNISDRLITDSQVTNKKPIRLSVSETLSHAPAAETEAHQQEESPIRPQRVKGAENKTPNRRKTIPRLAKAKKICYKH